VKRLVGFLTLLALIVAVAIVYVQRHQEERRYRELLSEGEAALARGQSYAAIESFSGALALRPESMAAYYRRGQAYAAQRQDDKAFRDLREAARLSPTAAAPLVALGALYDERGEPAQAADWYGQAAERLKDADPAVLYSLALSLYRAGSPAAAKDPLRRALARNDSSAEGYYLLGLVLRDSQNPDEAIAALEQAIRLSPSLVPAREELADIYHERGRLPEEMAQLKALADLSRGVQRRVAVGLAEANRSEFDSALETLAAAESSAPNDSRVFLATGRVLLMRAERSPDAHAVARAQSALERALGGTARRSEGLALYGRALYLAGDISAAERILQEAIATSPVDPEAYAFLADAAERNGHPMVARDALMDLDVLQGDTVSGRERGERARRIGALSLAANDVRTAATFLAQALDTAPDDPAALGMLARARWQLGDIVGAKLALGRALELNGTDAALQRLMRTINK
jgi:tetratricopeptide (TPR) repeat protein